MASIIEKYQFCLLNYKIILIQLMQKVLLNGDQ